MPLPEQLDTEGPQGAIGADEWHIFQRALSRKHAVKRIAVLVRPCSCPLRVDEIDGERLKPSFLNPLRNVAQQRVYTRELTHTVLGRDLPGTGGRDENLVLRVCDQLAGEL